MVHISFFSILVLDLWFIHYSTTAPMVMVVKDKVNSKGDTLKNIQQCQRLMTYNEIRHLLDHSPCAIDLSNDKIFSTNSKSTFRTKLNNDNDNLASSNNVYAALQSTIDDHRRMIHFLMNNTVNITQLDQYYIEQHIKITPIWKSWRDLSLLLLIIFYSGILIYFLASRIRPLDVLTSILLRRHQHKQQQQKQQDKQVSMVPPPTTTTPISTIKQEYLRYIHASESSSIG